MNTFKKMALGVAASVMALSGTSPATAQEARIQLLVPEHVRYMVVSMSSIIQQPNIVYLTDRSGESIKARLDGCNVRWRTGESWYFLTGGSKFYLIRKADLDMAHNAANGDWDTTIAYLNMVGKVCTAVYVGD